MKRKHVLSAVGAVAFVIGGLLARTATLENIEKLEAYLPHRDNDEETDPE